MCVMSWKYDKKTEVGRDRDKKYISLTCPGEKNDKGHYLSFLL